MKNFWQTIISQYATSPKIQTLLAAIDQWLSLDVDFELFYTTVWNIETASGYGLDVLGRIVVIPRAVEAAPASVFGFYEATDRVGFGQGPFAEAYSPNSISFTLSDTAYRQFILAKAAFNITNGSTPAINSILMNILFPGRGNAYVVDGLNMTMQYVFTFALQPFEIAMVQAGVLPKPTGVAATFQFLGN
jgi:Protein of unknown function (DUF2612)